MTRWLKFSAVGLVGVGVQLLALELLLRLHVHYLLATGLAVEAALLHNYAWHRAWTWSDRPGGKANLLRFHVANGLVSIASNVFWMRLLTGSGVLVEDKLFATLDTTVRALHPETRPRILVSDTVGFIKKLPHALVASFRSTLAEARDASLLVHVVDASDAAFRQHMEVTRKVLHELEAGDSPELLLLNKADRVEDAQRTALAEEFPDAVILSAKRSGDVAQLRERIVAFFEREMVDGDLFVPYTKGRWVSEVHARCRVLAESYEADGTRMTVRTHAAELERLRVAVGE